jgi:hypothetical protein
VWKPSVQTEKFQDYSLFKFRMNSLNRKKILISHQRLFRFFESALYPWMCAKKSSTSSIECYNQISEQDQTPLSTNILRRSCHETCFVDLVRGYRPISVTNNRNKMFSVRAHISLPLNKKLFLLFENLLFSKQNNKIKIIYISFSLFQYFPSHL